MPVTKSNCTGWSKKQLGEILTLNYGWSLPEKNRVVGGAPVYGSNGIVGSHNQALVPSQGIIVGRKGSAGNVHFSREPFCPIDTTFFVAPSDTQLDIEFVYYLLLHVDLKRILGDVGVPGLNREMAYREQTQFPNDKAEQQKIAAVLGLVQRAMEQQERLLRLTAELKKTLLLQLFTYGLRHDSRKQTDLGPLPQSWDAVELGRVADVINGFAFKSEDYVSSGVLNFRVVNIRDEGVIDTSSDTKFLPNEFMQTHKQYLLSEGDILLVMVGATRGKLAFIPKSILPALMNQNMWRIVPKSPKEMHRKYLYYFLTIAVPKFVREFSESARGFFKKSDFRSIKLPKPTFTEQQEIADAMDNVEQKLGLHRRQHAALSGLFRTLLHELMTARIRVHDLDLGEIGCSTGIGKT